MPTYLLFDVGSTYTKGCIVDINQERILAQASALTTATTDISIGIQAVKDRMKDVLSTVKIDQTLVCSSAKGGLKMIAVGLVPDLTLKAATLACFSAGAKVIQAFSFMLNDQEIKQIEDSGCDLLLLTGGTDGGNRDVVLHNASKLSKLNRKFPVVYAGNKSCQDEVKDILTKCGFEVTCCPNVMPVYGVLEVEECRDKIRDLFLSTIVKAKGLSELNSLIKEIVLPTPYSVMEALKLLSSGTKNENGIGDLMAVDIGGATTDVYSMNKQFVVKDNVGYKGLKEPLQKRSVEGDLGVRFNAHSVYELKSDEVDDDGMKDYVQKIEEGKIDSFDTEKDSRLAAWCCEIACQRHAGRMETSYTPMGVGYYQSGKDLRDVRILIGIGGPILHSKTPEKILKNAISQASHPEVLLPLQIDAYLDRNYVVSCLGLLASRHPDVVLRLLKRNVEKLNDE
ncbi:MAG TPA: MutL protein [Erysipelotrichaceae bacterium]|nr:MAG: hypothetical protein A2Y19_05605 [Firmicutes bacterium GWE2_51_13]HBZ42438.1 MutL protein [Erysipelotrichaceae bacterium]